MSLADTYREKAQAFLPGIENVSDRFCAILLAKDLMVDSPEDFKVGYSRESATLAAIEIFPEVTYDEIIERI